MTNERNWSLHLQLDPAQLHAPQLEKIKLKCAAHPGPASVYFHIPTGQGLVIIRSKSLTADPVNEDLLNDLLILEAVSGVKKYSADVTDYYILKDIFQADASAQDTNLALINQQYYNIIRASQLPPMKVQLLLHNSKVVEKTAHTITVAFPDEHTLAIVKTNGTHKNLQQMLMHHFNENLKLKIILDDTLRVSMNALSDLVTGQSVESTNLLNETSPIYAKPPANSSERKKSNYSATPPRPPKTPRKKIHVPQTPEEIEAKILDIFDGVMDTRFLPLGD